jgi:hypothetical protein
VSEARHIPLDGARLTVSAAFTMRGSIIAGTAEHRLASLETALALDSTADAAAVRALVAQAERMCFVLDAIGRPHAVARRVTLNGDSLSPDSPDAPA